MYINTQLVKKGFQHPQEVNKSKVGIIIIIIIITGIVVTILWFYL